MTLEIVTGDLLDAKEKYIAHQCNCVTQNCAGVAKLIFDKWPYANTYALRQLGPDGRTIPTDKLGDIVILGDGKEQRHVINMYAQYYPGKPKYPTSTLDGSAVRLDFFYKCLLRVAKIPELESIAFPWRIGCNLGGGDWEKYLGTLNNFAQYVEETQKAKVVIYRISGDE